MNRPTRETCLQCGRPYRPKRFDHKFCSSTCRLRHWRRCQALEQAERLLNDLDHPERAMLAELEALAPGTREALAELVADHGLLAGEDALRLAAHVATHVVRLEPLAE